jgi:hypothetical protein
MRKLLLPLVFLAGGALLAQRAGALEPEGMEGERYRVSFFPAQGPRVEPIDVNLIIDGSRYMEGPGGDAAAWLCGYVVDGMLRPGDYLRIWVAGDQAASLYEGVLGEGDMGAVKDLLQRPLPGSRTADLEGALRAALVPPVAPPGEGRSPLITYTLLVSSVRGRSQVHLGLAAPYLRFSRVMDFPGWLALVMAPDIDRRVRDAAGAFLSGR